VRSIVMLDLPRHLHRIPSCGRIGGGHLAGEQGGGGAGRNLPGQTEREIPPTAILALFRQFSAATWMFETRCRSQGGDRQIRKLQDRPQALLREVVEIDLAAAIARAVCRRSGSSWCEPADPPGSSHRVCPHRGARCRCALAFRPAAHQRAQNTTKGGGDQAPCTTGRQQALPRAGGVAEPAFIAAEA